MSKIRVISPMMGDDFGGKVSLVTEPVTTLLAIKTGCPVKVVYNRTEEFCCTCTRHTAKVDLTIAMKKDGTITVADEAMILNADTHTSATMSTCWAARGKFHEPSRTRNTRCREMPVYTSTSVASVMRGFGSPQQFFLISSVMSETTQSLHLDPSNVFLKNLTDPSEVACNDGESFSNFRLEDRVAHRRELTDWYEAKKRMEASRKEKDRHLIGASMAYGSHGTSMFPFIPDITGIAIKMSGDGAIVFTTGTSDTGDGSVTTQCMLVSGVLDIPLDYIAYIKTDAGAAMSDLGAYASRGTYTNGRAAVKTARVMRGKIAVLAAELLDTTTDNLDFHGGIVWYMDTHRKFVSMKEIAAHAREKHQEDLSCSYVFHSEADPMNSGAHFTKMQVDMVTGGIKILEYAAVHDVGRVMNPMGITGQLEGGISTGLGYALCEEVKLDSTGRDQTSSLKKYHILNMKEMSKLSVGFLNSREETGPYGAKSIGECAVVPVALAIASAVSSAVGGQFYKLPIRPEGVLEALSLVK